MYTFKLLRFSSIYIVLNNLHLKTTLVKLVHCFNITSKIIQSVKSILMKFSKKNISQTSTRSFGQQIRSKNKQKIVSVHRECCLEGIVISTEKNQFINIRILGTPVISKL